MLPIEKVLFDNNIRIIQSSKKRTGSTLMVNILYGLISPNKPVIFYNDELIKKNLVFKSHNTNFSEIEKRFNNYKLYFISIERDNLKIEKKYHEWSNTIIFNYNQLINKSTVNLVKMVADKLGEMLKISHSFNINRAVKRVNNMNIRCEELKDKSFNFIDSFYQIHGSHRNRDKIKEIPYFIPAKTPEKRKKDQKIPYVMFQTMKTRNLPFHMYQSVITWINKNPEYDYYFFDDDKCIQFIKDNYPETYLLCFMMLKAGAAKADLFRWLYLNKNGGIYMDIDTICFNSISQFLKKNIDFISVEGPTIKYRINHSFIGSVQNNQIIKKSIKKAISNILILLTNKENVKAPHNICGPTVLGKVINKIMNRPINTVFSDNTNHVFTIENMTIFIFDHNESKKYFSHKYGKYQEDLKILGEIHHFNNIAFDYKYAMEIFMKYSIKIDYRYK